MIEENKKVPVWILAISGLIALLELMVSYMLVFSPQSVMETADLNANGVMYLFYMWAARQFALGVIFAYATIRRSFQMLTLAFIFFLVMMLGDLAIGISQNETSLVASASVMAVISAILIIILNRRKATGAGNSNK